MTSAVRTEIAGKPTQNFSGVDRECADLMRRLSRVLPQDSVRVIGAIGGLTGPAQVDYESIGRVTRMSAGAAREAHQTALDILVSPRQAQERLARRRAVASR